MGGGESHWQALTIRSARRAVAARKLRSEERVAVKTVIPETMGEQGRQRRHRYVVKGFVVKGYGRNLSNAR